MRITPPQRLKCFLRHLGRKTTPRPVVSQLDQGLRRQTRLALLVGVLAICGSGIVGYAAYHMSRSAIVTHVLASHLQLARSLSKDTPPAADGTTSTQQLRALEQAWQQESAITPYPNRYLCVIDAQGTLALNTRKPAAVGRQIGAVPLLASPENRPQNLQQLLAAKQDYAGPHRSWQGEQQVAAFVYSPSLDALIAVHVPWADVRAEIWSASLLWAGGLAVITAVLFPVALGLLHRAYAASQSATAGALVALQESEKRFRQLIEGSLQGILIHREDSALFVNQTYADIFGYAHPDDIMRMDSLLPLIAPHEHARLLRYRDDRLAGKAVPAHYEYQGMRQDGSFVWLDMQVRLVTWNGVPAVQSTVFDITDRTRAEEALRQSEDRYRSVVEGSLQAIVIHQDGLIQYVNPACLALFGYASPSELVAQPMLETLIAPEAQEELQARTVARLRGDPVPPHHGWQGLRRDGTRLWVESTATVIDWQERPAIVSFFTDITERKEAEDARTRLEAQLHQSQKMEAIGTLAGGIAHDFNNILGAIFGYTELALCDVPRGNPAQANLQEALTAARRAKDLVQQILTFSRQSETCRHPVALAPLLTETLQLLRASLPSTIAIEQDCPDDIGTIAADPTQLHQVLMHLGANAEYAMRATGGTLTVGVDVIELDATGAAELAVLGPGLYLRLTVSDTGPGIPSEVRDRIFDPFFTTKAVDEGTGMGLAMVHGIVTQYGGAITVDSTMGVGTTFTIYLPRFPEDTSLQAYDDHAMPHGTGRLLFVDDELPLVRSIPALLAKLGYTVEACTSGQEALARVQADPTAFDVVITDQTMSQMTGETLVKALHCTRADLPIILCTGFSHLIDAEKAQAIGVAAFCMKPLSVQELADTIQQVLQQRAAQSAPTSRARIVLIDDDAHLRAMLRQMLESAGYSVVEASNGREGVQRYREAPTDLIITDLLMPEQDGLETIEVLRQDDPAVKILAMSGGTRIRNMDFLPVAQQLGAHRMLYKPFGRDELLTTIREMLQE